MQCCFVERTQALDLILKLPEVSSNVEEEFLEVSDPARARLRINYQISLTFAEVNFVKCPSISSVIREVKHHVYVKRQTRICTTWPSFPITCRLLFTISTHKLVVSHNFLSKRIALDSFFFCSFSILRNSQLESDVCHLPSTWCLNSLFYSRIRERARWSKFFVPIGYPSGQDGPIEPARYFPR